MVAGDSNDIGNKFNNVKNELFKDGGYPQAMAILSAIICDDGIIKLRDLLQMIGWHCDDMKEKLEKNYIIPIERYDYLAKVGKKYACLDKDMKFCIREKGKSEWNDVSHVMPYYDIYKAAEILKVNLF